MSDRAGGSRRTEFLRRGLYRRRRLLDAMRLLPLLGLFLFLSPPFLLAGEPGATAIRLVYFFLCWAGLIALCAILVRFLPRTDGEG